MAKGQGALHNVPSAKRSQAPLRRSERVKNLKRAVAAVSKEEYVIEEKPHGPNRKRRRVSPNLTKEVPSDPKSRSEYIDTARNVAHPSTQGRDTDCTAVAPSTQKNPKRTRGVIQKQPIPVYDPVAHWSLNETWPPNFRERGFQMSEKLSSKRRSSSTHRSDVIQRMAAYGVFMSDSEKAQASSKELCHTLLGGDRQIVQTSVFNFDEFDTVLKRVASLNEARIQRDITPWIAPSAETLNIQGHLGLTWIREEINAEWYKCSTLGSTKPKPDYTAGLGLDAFSKEEIEKLNNRATPDKPFFVTADLSFPFLMCEVKNCEAGLTKAERQNVHSASIAVNALVQLYHDAYGETDLDLVQSLSGQVLVFTVSHSNDTVSLYGHFAIFDAKSIEDINFHRHHMAFYHLSLGDGQDRLKSYNFVINVYERFAETHRKRIKDAVAHLPTPVPRAIAADMGDDTGGNAFKKPGESSSASRQNTLIEQLREDFARREAQQEAQHEAQQVRLIEQLREDFARREAQQEAQHEAQQVRLIEQLREDFARREAQQDAQHEAQQVRLIEQLREDFAKREEQQTKLNEQLREEFAKQVVQQREDFAKREEQLQSQLQQLIEQLVKKV